MDEEDVDNALTTLFGDSGAQLKLTLKSISEIQSPDLTTVGNEFDQTYRVLLGFVFAVAFVGMFVTALWSAWRVMTGTGTPKQAWKAPLYVFLVGTFLPAAIIIIRLPLNALSKFIMDTSSSSSLGAPVDWQAALSQDYTVSNAFSKIMYATLSWITRKILEAEVFILNWSLPVLVCLLIVSYGVAMTFKGGLGKVSRWFLSLVIVAIIAQPILLFILGLSGRALAASSISEDWKAFIVFLIQVVAAAAIVMLVWLTHAQVDAFAQNRAEMTGDVNANITDNHAANAEMQQNLSQRFEVMNRNEQHLQQNPSASPAASGQPATSSTPAVGGQPTHSSTPSLVGVGAGAGAAVAATNLVNASGPSGPIGSPGANGAPASNNGSNLVDTGLAVATVVHPVAGTAASTVHSYLKNAA